MDLPLDAPAAATAAAAAVGGCVEGAEAVLELRADLARDELWAPAVRPGPCCRIVRWKGCCGGPSRGVTRRASAS